jgi:hypothetical protein
MAGAARSPPIVEVEGLLRSRLSAGPGRLAVPLSARRRQGPVLIAASTTPLPMPPKPAWQSLATAVHQTGAPGKHTGGPRRGTGA